MALKDHPVVSAALDRFDAAARARRVAAVRTVNAQIANGIAQRESEAALMESSSCAEEEALARESLVRVLEEALAPPLKAAP